jgi:hypothetical protein
MDYQVTQMESKEDDLGQGTIEVPPVRRGVTFETGLGCVLGGTLLGALSIGALTAAQSTPNEYCCGTGLDFVIGAIIGAPVGLVVGVCVLTGLWVSRRRRRRGLLS